MFLYYFSIIFLFLLSFVSLSSISPQWASLNKKIIYDLQLVNSAVSNMRLHCSLIAKIISSKTFDGASFWVKNIKKIRFLAFERFDKNALIQAAKPQSNCRVLCTVGYSSHIHIVKALK